jgi:hypothetical protein
MRRTPIAARPTADPDAPHQRGQAAPADQVPADGGSLCCGDYQPLMITTGRWLVYLGAGATAVRADLAGRRRVLGPTSFFAPSASPGEVWLEYLTRRAAQVRPDLGVRLDDGRRVSDSLR